MFLGNTKVLSLLNFFGNTAKFKNQKYALV